MQIEKPNVFAQNLSAEWIVSARYEGAFLVGWVFSSRDEGEKTMRELARLLASLPIPN